MIKRITVFFILLYAGLWCLQQAPSSRAAGWLPLAKSAGGAVPFNIDGTTQCNSTTAATVVLPAFSNTFTNGLAYVSVLSNSGPVTVADTAGLTWTKRVTANDGIAAHVSELWSGPSTGILTSDVATISNTGSGFITSCIASFSGSHFASPFDPNGAIPNGAANCSWTTTNANDILIGTSRENSSTSGAGTGFTSPTNANLNFILFQYKIVSATQSGINYTDNGTTFNPAVCDAIIQGP